MNGVTQFKYWLAGGALIFVFFFLALVVFLTNIGNEIKASIITFFITVPGTLIIQYYFRKAGSNEADSDINGTLPKVNGPVTGSQSTVQGWGECTNCGEPVKTNGNATEKSVASFSPAPAPVLPQKPQNGKKTADSAISEIMAGLKADGIEPNVAAVSSRIVSYWGAHFNDFVDDKEAYDFIDAGRIYAGQAFNEVTGLLIPTEYKEVADYNKYWRTHSKGCKVDRAVARPLLMTLRDLLRIKESL